MGTARRSSRATGTAALALALVLTACSGAQEAPAAGPASEQASAGEQDGGGSNGSSDSGAGVEDVDVDDVLVEQVVAQPDAPDDRATIGVRSLRVEGDVMVLELVVTPDFASVSDSELVSLFDVWRRVSASITPTLLDRVNLKRYEVVDGGPGRAFTSDPSFTRSLNGQPMRAFTVFAAPEDDIDVIDVVLADVWPAFTDVPVER